MNTVGISSKINICYCCCYN